MITAMYYFVTGRTLGTKRHLETFSTMWICIRYCWVGTAFAQNVKMSFMTLQADKRLILLQHIVGN